jgi:hypothetical protein
MSSATLRLEHIALLRLNRSSPMWWYLVMTVYTGRTTNIIIWNNSFIIHRIRKCFRQNLRGFKWDTLCVKQIICLVRILPDIRASCTSLIRTSFLHSDRSCRVDQYQSNDHTLSAIAMDCCVISRQKSRVNRSVCRFAGLGKRSPTAHLALVPWVATSHEQFFGMALSVWSLDSHCSAL